MTIDYECQAFLGQVEQNGHKLMDTKGLALLFHLFIFRGIQEHIHSDNGTEFTARVIRRWLSRLGVKALFIEPGSPWENGCIESFNVKLRDELLSQEIFTKLEEAKVLIEQWRREYNQVSPHSSLGYQPPAHKVTHNCGCDP